MCKLKLVSTFNEYSSGKSLTNVNADSRRVRWQLKFKIFCNDVVIPNEAHLCSSNVGRSKKIRSSPSETVFHEDWIVKGSMMSNPSIEESVDRRYTHNVVRGDVFRIDNETQPAALVVERPSFERKDSLLVPWSV